ncbi:hypothetical protein [Actinomadura terrae]|uniref:hypothetical protein n=1 Tax=Actinomadura terrae TaxID=604353 RepID=UPI001FA79A07|nr:hypothetical protein [Actinomadura terrae]
MVHGADETGTPAVQEEAADRCGPLRPMTWGMLVLAAGGGGAGTAPTWLLFLAGRFLQGRGDGHGLREASSVWTFPSLVGPATTGILAERTTWRSVFLLILLLIAVAAVLSLPPLRGLGRAGGTETAPAGLLWWKRPLGSSVLLTNAAALVAVGVLVTVPALRWVAPPGTLSARRGLGAGVAVRALLCGAYFGTEAFLPLGLQESRGMSATASGLGLGGAAIAIGKEHDSSLLGVLTGLLAVGGMLLARRRRPERA